MKIERGEVEKMLAACEPGSDTFLQVTEELTRRKLRALCRTWLAVQDAPVGLAESIVPELIYVRGDAVDSIFSGDLENQRVRLVRDGGE